MANNRMSLVNIATGQRVLLATRLATQWQAISGIEYKLDRAFVAELEFPAARGSTAWRVEYENDETELDEELRRKVESHASPALAGTPDPTPWGMLRAYAAFCRSCPGDASRASFAAAIEALLAAWSRGRELSETHRATIYTWMRMHAIDPEVTSALDALSAQIRRR